jgi:transcriptional regulator with XRE-family HTH domain
MPSREGRFDQATLAARRALVRFGEEVRRARLDAGLSQTRAGLSAGVSHTQVSRIEAGRSAQIGLVDLARVAAAVGLDLSIRAYPGPEPLRDIGHLRLLDRFRSKLPEPLDWRVEVPMPGPADQRAWDAVIFGAGAPIAVEAETRLTDVQRLERRIALKRRDSRIQRVVLVLADTRWNRQALRAASSALALAFPVPASRILGALASGQDPGGSGVVVL